MSPFTKGMSPPDGPQGFASITSTSDLTPAGVLGYAKTIAAFVAGLITVLVPFLPIGSDAAHYAQIAVAVAGFVAVYAVPNKVQPVAVDPEV